MNKTKKYSEILEHFLSDLAAKYQNASDGLTTIAIIDKEHHHYQSAIHGFQKEPAKHVFIVQFHFDIIDGKVWIQKNSTDIPIEQDLRKLGIPKSDIVFGCVPEDARYFHGYGVEELNAV